MSNATAYDLFISYAAADRAWVDGYLLDALKQAGVHCLSESAFELGTPRLLEFERAVQQSRRTLLIVSRAYMADGYDQFFELLATTYGLETSTWPVIPLKLQDLALPPRLAILEALDATAEADWPTAIERLCQALQRPLPAPTPRPPCPYPGMAPFDTESSTRFFGRDAEIGELLERLRLHPFLAMIGPSGCGKSSLVFAGLIPQLNSSGLFNHASWRVQPMRPGETPLDNLAAALGLPAAQALSAAPVPLAAVAPDHQHLLLVIDQFEELFTLAGPDPDAFQQALLNLAATPGCYVILTARADFYPDLMVTQMWPAMRDHRFEITPLAADGLRQAVMRPAEAVGVYIEAALVERLVLDAAGEPGALPLVQETLVLLWERIQRRYLPLSAYDLLVLPLKAYGGSVGARRTGLQLALARRADAVLGDLSAPQQLVARRIFLRLIQFGDGRADTRRQAGIEQLRSAYDAPGMLEQTLEHLAQGRLLTRSGDERGAARVDLAHESLITGWPKLAAWIQEGRSGETARRQIDQTAREWQAHKQDASFLYRGAQLNEARRGLALAPADLTEGIENFLAASRRRAAIFTALKRLALLVVVALACIPVYSWARDWALRRAATGPTTTFAAATARLGSDADSAARIYPERRQEVSAFAIELHEVTYRQYRLCVQAGRCTRPLEPSDDASFDRADERLPVVWVNGYQAAAFCGWIGRRLPTEAEWERAARGVDGRPWPWGGADEPADRSRANLIFSVPTTGTVTVDNPNFQAGTTPEKITHMLGNVWEWTSTTCSDDPYGCPEAWDGQSRAINVYLRGRSWLQDLPPNDPQPLTYSLAADPIYTDRDYGFRCAQPAP